jgi:hypothetical protein
MVCLLLPHIRVLYFVMMYVAAYPIAMRYVAAAASEMG